MKIRTVDLGNYNVKTGEGLTFKSAYTNIEPTDTFLKSKTVEFGEEKYYIGTGNWDVDLVKSRKKMLPLFLYALGSSMTTESEVNHVVIGLPAQQYNEYKEQMADNYKGQYELKINGKKSISIDVADIIVFPEGAGVFYTLPEPDRQGDVIIIDIGGKTTNIAWFRDGVLRKAATLPHGVFAIYEEVLKKVNPSGVHTGLDMEYVERSLDKGELMWNGEKKDLSCMIKIKEQLHHNIYQLMYQKEFPIGASKFRLAGGGAKLMLDEFEHFDCKIVKDALFANANGFKEVGRMVWQNK